MAFWAVDWVIIFVYACIVFTVGMLVMKKPKTSEEYFLADRKLRWPFIGASLLASNISAEHFVGLAGMGYMVGLAVGAAYEWSAIFCLMPLIIIFLPLYLKNKIYTVPEYLERRFNLRIRKMLSGVMLVMSVLTKISISLWASAVVFSTMFGWHPYAVIAVVAITTALYTMKGGLSAVVYTDAIQVVVLLIAAVILTSLGLQHVGGWQAFHAKVPAQAFSVIRPISDPDLPWTGVLFGVFLGASFYWSMDQVLVQRVFAAKSLNEGRKGAVLAGFLKLFIPFILVMPGIIAKVSFPHLESGDQAYPTLLKTVMPHGLLGLTVAGIAAALMGHLSATYNSVATMFTRDFYLQWRPGATQSRQIWFGRLSVALVCTVGAVWAPIIGHFKSLWDYLQNLQFYVFMPFVAIFFCGALWKRVNSAGVWAAVATGGVLGPLFLVDRMLPSHFLPFMSLPIMRPWLHGAVLELIVCTCMLVTVSLLTPAPSKEQVATTTVTWGSGYGEAVVERVSFFHDYKTWLTIVVLLAVSLYYIWR